MKEPKKGTQKAKVLKVLRNSDYISHWDLIQQTEILSAPRYLRFLRADGHNIIKKMHTYQGGGKSRTIGKYKLEEKSYIGEGNEKGW